MGHNAFQQSNDVFQFFMHRLPPILPHVAEV
jgi:hypothetical protein